MDRWASPIRPRWGLRRHGQATACSRVTTDGSLLMAAGALETAARTGAPVMYVQLSNGSLGWIKALQYPYYQGRFASTQISRLDTAAVARGFGVPASLEGSLEDLAHAVRDGLAGGRSALVDVLVPDEHDVLPPVAPWERAAARPGTGRAVY